MVFWTHYNDTKTPRSLCCWLKLNFKHNQITVQITCILTETLGATLKIFWNITNWWRHVVHNYSGHLHKCPPIRPFSFHSQVQQWMWVHSTGALIEVIADESCCKMLFILSVIRMFSDELLHSSDKLREKLKESLNTWRADRTWPWVNSRSSNTQNVQTDPRAGAKHKCRVRTTATERRWGQQSFTVLCSLFVWTLLFLD